MSSRLDRAFAVLFATGACAGPDGDSPPAAQATGEDAGGSSTMETTMGNPALRGLLTLDEYDWARSGGASASSSSISPRAASGAFSTANGRLDIRTPRHRSCKRAGRA